MAEEVVVKPDTLEASEVEKIEEKNRTPAQNRIVQLVSQRKAIEAERDALKEECERMRTAAAYLSNEVLGSLPLMEPLARREFGNTNYHLLIQRAEELRAALTNKASES